MTKISESLSGRARFRRWRYVRWPTASCVLLLTVMWSFAAVAAGQMNDQSPVNVEGITVSLTVAIGAALAALACAWKVAREFADLAAAVRELRGDMDAMRSEQNERHRENLRRLESLETRRR